MKTLTRREFLGASAMSLLALKANAARPFAAHFYAPLTFQYWVVRGPMGEDLSGTLKKMRAIGYDGVELCSPVGYAPFVDFETTDPAELKRRVTDAGLVARSSHFVGDEVLGDNVHTAIETADALGLDAVILSSANFNETEATLDQWKQFAEEANAAGETLKGAGFQLGYHNHHIGPEIDGRPAFDHLMGLLDPDLVKMQFQISTIREGYDIVEYLEKYAGRFIALHLSDWDPAQDGGVPVGSGTIDWQKVMAAAGKSPIADYGYIVEVGTEDPFRGVTDSYAYLSRFTL